MAQKVINLDNAGAAQYTEQQLRGVFENLTRLNLANPHSRNPASRLCTDLVDQARCSEYSVIFTSGATAALKLVAECFDFGSADADSGVVVEDSTSLRVGTDAPLSTPSFVYLKDNHTSVLGMRELVKSRTKCRVYCVTADEVENRLRSSTTSSSSNHHHHQRNLFVFPGQSNYCGRKYPLEWISRVRDGCLNGSGRWFVCLDAASLVSTNALNLSVVEPDFVTISFYKIFGYPTGLGALLIRNSSAFVLNKQYFGGGTVFVSIPDINFHKKRDNPTERFEDGTIDFLGIVALKHGFDAVQSAGGIDAVSDRSFHLARYAHYGLISFKHENQCPVAVIYSHEPAFNDPRTQGPIVNFNLTKPDGSFVGFTQVEKMAELYNIHLRTGCFCNQGACQEYLSISNDDLTQHFQKGKVCGDEIDLIDGRPVGSVRISFGIHNTVEDVHAFLGMVYDCFVVNPPYSWRGFLERLQASPIAMQEHTACNNTDSTDKASVADTAFPNVGIVEQDPCMEVAGSSNDASGTRRSLPSATATTAGVPERQGLRLTEILLYPVKSAGVMRVPEWPLSATGLAYDRKWMVADKDGLCLTQKRCPQLCALLPRVRLDKNLLVLKKRNGSAEEDCELPLAFDRRMDTDVSCESKVCADRVSTADCGNDVAAWLENVLDMRDCRLQRQTDDILRIAKPDTNSNESEAMSLANSAQYLLIHRASVRRLLSVVRDAMADVTEDELIRRFRPNLVLDGGAPFEEDAWTSVRIGDTTFNVVGKCQRCQMICINQETGVKTPKILTALRDIRRGQIRARTVLTTSAQA